MTRYLALRDPLLGRSARAHIARGQVQHASAIAHLGHLDERAAAGLLHVVGMRRDRQYVHAHARAASFFRNSRISTLHLNAFTPLIAITGTSSLYIRTSSGSPSMSTSW